MRWPWQARETREAIPFTDAVVAALAAQATGTTAGDPSAIAALETAAGIWARCFAAAKVKPDTPRTRAITPAVLALIARDLIRRGESLFLVDVEQGAVMLRASGSWDVRGGWREAEWWYRLDLFGPSGNITKFVPGDEVVHCRYAFDPSRPWLGLSPLQWARATGRLAANLELRLGEEAGASVGFMFTYPQAPKRGDTDAEDQTKALRSDIRSGKGRHLLVQTTAAGLGEGRQAAPQKDWVQSRFGADPPQALATLRSDAGLAVLNACGVPPALATDADGTSQRESWRRFVMGGVEPVARTVALELGAKLDVPDLAFSFDSLWAHDLAGRASSFKAMVTAGMEVERAAGLAGLLSDEAA